MGEVITIGLDIAKSVFQVHGVDEVGTVAIRKRVSRSKMLEFFADLPPCLVGIEACPAAHHWGRELQALGHTVKLMPPSYVKAYLKRGKNDANDAAAICEAVSRPSMRFVAIKTKEQQAALMLHRARQLLVRQRTMLSNAIRGHLAELGVVSAKGRNGTGELLEIILNGADSRIPLAAGSILKVLAAQYARDRRSDRINRQEYSGLASLLRAEPAAGRDSGRRADCRNRSCCRDRRLEGVQVGAWFGCLDRAGAEATHDWRQGQARQHHQAGQSILAMASRRRRHGRDPLRAKARHEEAAVVRAIDGAPTDKSGCCRLGQQNGTDRVGHHDPRREIQGARAAAGSLRQPIGNTNWQGHDDVMQIRSFRGSGEPVWVIALPSAGFRLGPAPRRALGPAANLPH